MFTWSRRSKQTFHFRGPGRGVCGARKLIPMPAQTSCAPALPTPQASNLRPQASGLKPQASSCSESAVAGRPQPPLYRTIDGLGRMLRMAWQMHTNSCPVTNKIALMPVGTGRYDADSRPPRPRLTFDAGQADTAVDWQPDARPRRCAE